MIEVIIAGSVILTANGNLNLAQHAMRCSFGAIWTCAPRTNSTRPDSSLPCHATSIGPVGGAVRPRGGTQITRAEGGTQITRAARKRTARRGGGSENTTCFFLFSQLSFLLDRSILISQSPGLSLSQVGLSGKWGFGW